MKGELIGLIPWYHPPISFSLDQAREQVRDFWGLRMRWKGKQNMLKSSFLENSESNEVKH